MYSVSKVAAVMPRNSTVHWVSVKRRGFPDNKNTTRLFDVSMLHQTSTSTTAEAHKRFTENDDDVVCCNYGATSGADSDD